MAADVEGNGDEEVGGMEELLGKGLLCEAVGEHFGDSPSAAVFDLVDEVFEGVIEGCESEDAVVGIEALSEAPGAWGGK